jgi:hypothetical protein
VASVIKGLDRWLLHSSHHRAMCRVAQVARRRKYRL